MSTRRSELELIEIDDPAWPGLEGLIADAPLPVKILPISPDQGQGRTVLYQLQVTARSTLGALALNCGGLLIDHGWLRILGGGTQGLPDLAEVNHLKNHAQSSGSPPYMIVAFDVLGGEFAIDGGGLGLGAGQVCYWAPDSLEWSGTGLGHTDFMNWALTDGPTRFFSDMRWDGWQKEVENLSLSQGIAIYPPLCSAEAYPIENASRRAISFDEVYGFQRELASSLQPDSTIETSVTQ